MPDPSSHEFIWPLPKVHLVRLIDVGLSDLNIAACFSVDCEDVRLLRERYRLRGGPGALAVNDHQAISMIDTECLDELSNSVQAAMSYANSALKCASSEDIHDATTTLLVRKTVEQLLRIARTYQRLRATIDPEGDQ